MTHTTPAVGHGRANGAAAAVPLDGTALTPEAVAAVARQGAPVTFTAGARARNAAARATVRELLAAGEELYGVTTGVGALRDRKVPAGGTADHQRRLLRSHVAAIGEPLAPALVRAAMTVRINQLGAGGGGVSDALIDSMCALLEAGLTPVVHRTGSLGTGDLEQLSELALVAIGEGEVWDGTERLPAQEALERIGLPPVELRERDASAFMSSNAPTIGRAALVGHDARRLHEAGLAVAALSFEAAGANRSVLDARVHAARPLPGQAAVAERMRALLDGGTTAPPQRTRAIHDPFGFRCQPQVDGAKLDAIVALERVLEADLNAAAENALIVAADGVALSSGNFHIGALALALDGLRAAHAQAAWLVAERTSTLLDSRFTDLPAVLASEPEPSSGALILEYTAHSAAGEIATLASPASAQHASIASGMETHASFAGTAVWLAERALERSADLLAAELVTAFRALKLSGRIPHGQGTLELFSRADRALPAELADRPLTDDLRAARKLIVD